MSKQSSDVPAGQSAMLVSAQDDPEAVEVAAYLIRNKQEPAHRGVRLSVDPSCYDTNFETLPLMTVAQHERIVEQYKRSAERFRAALELIADTDPDDGCDWFHAVANAALSAQGESHE